MIAPKTVKPTAREESDAYALAEIRDDGTCVKCRRGHDISRDHRKNRSQGGLTVVENLQILCSACHLWKTDHPEEANREGWGVPGWADPAEYPGRRWMRTQNQVLVRVWCLYGRKGTLTPISDREAAQRIAGEIR